MLLREGGTAYRHHTDPSGAPIRLTAPGGRTVWEADLDAFGQAQVRIGEIAQPWRLPGQYADDEFGLGLHYNRFRYYDPAIGRYISRDPIGVAGGLNLYLYVGNDPINRADPLGLWWKTALSIVAAVAVAAVVVLTAPISGPLLLIAAGAAAGAAGFMVNEGLNQETFCVHCILLAGLKGAAVGALAAVPFLFLPAAAGYAAYAGVGAISGFLSYAGEWALTPGAPWSWKAAAISTGLGAVMGPAGKFIGGKIAARRPVSSAPEPLAAPAESVAPPKPTGPTEPYNRKAHYGRTPTAADRRAVGAGKGQVADHDPPLVKRYYEGDPATGEKPGWQMTPEERAASAGDRSRMSPQDGGESNSQGGQMSAYSREMKRKLGL